MAAVSWSDPTATPSLTPEQILFTSGGSVTIDAPASVVFDVITGFSRYGEWNTWTPSLAFSQADEAVSARATGTLKAEMKAQKREYEIPIEILVLERTPHRYQIAWQSQLMPTWMATMERVQVVEPLDGNPGACTVQSWESSSGVAAYVFKYALGVPAQVQEANLNYLNELKSHAEKVHSK